MCYEIFVRNNDVIGWSRPMFPKVNQDLDILRLDGQGLTYLYDHVGVFKDGELVEEISKADD